MKASFLTRLFDLIAPRICAICGRRLSVGESVLCASCHLHLPLTRFWLSPYDNQMARLFWGQIPLAGGQPDQRPNSMERAAALYYYEAHSQASQVVYDLKYHGHRNVAEHMGRIAAQTMMGGGFFDGIDLIVPIPLTRRRQWSRGYNQSREIARGVSQVTGIPVDDGIVKRTAFAGSQTHRHAWDRRQNVEKAFSLVAPQKVEHRHILIIDDVVTTGATVASCARQLCQADDVRISILSLCFTKR